MQKRLLCLALAIIPSLTFSQTGTGIKWTSGLSWQQIKAKAKKENKYIFVDAYATWCKPCKEMDANVYTVDSVADFLNKGFIPVKVQMDQTNNDDANIKSWYKTAGYMTREYNLNAYPTMLFFTPSGEIVTKEVGYKDAPSLIEAAKKSQDPSKQYYVLLKNYKKGKLDDAAKRSLINTAKQLGDTINYRALRDDYFNYLRALPKDKLYTKENIEFIAGTINRRSQPIFDMFYPDGSAVDRVMEKNGYAEKVVDGVIMKEKVAAIVNAGLDSKIEPDWKNIYNSIENEYNSKYADRNVMDAKMSWYYNADEFLKWARTLNDRIERYGTDTTGCSGDGTLNNQAFFIWKHVGSSRKINSEEITELKRACVWMEGAVRRGEFATGWCRPAWSAYIDTYANLLHKVGRTSEAIKWEELAVVKEKEVGENSQSLIEFYEDNINKMRKAEPTWPIAEK